MNKYLIGGISFVAGAGISAFATYKILKKKYEVELDKQIQEFKSEYKLTRRFPVIDIDDNSSVNPSEDIDKEEKRKLSITDADSSLDQGKDIYTEKVAYHKIASNYKKQLEDVAAENESPTEEDTSEGNKIYILSSDEYNTSELESVNLVYFAEEGRLYDGNDEVEYPERLVGNCLESIDIPKGEEGVIYIRNEDVEVDYEIDVLWDRYDTNDE